MEDAGLRLNFKSVSFFHNLTDLQIFFLSKHLFITQIKFSITITSIHEVFK